MTNISSFLKVSLMIRIHKLFAKIHKKFRSEIDKGLEKHREQKNLSDSQQAEVNKHASIHQKRDNKEAQSTKNKIWEDF